MEGKMRLLRKVIFLFIGFAIAEILYKYLFMNIFGGLLSNVDVPGSSLIILSLYIVRPICILAGSVVTGYNLNMVYDETYWGKYVYNPGILVSLIMLIDLITRIYNYGFGKLAHRMDDIMGWLICSLIYVIVSSFGVYCGNKMRMRKNGIIKN
ncbi:MAG TPA: hypothetical protein PLO63_01915 [Syntrophales bacterium]|nr:hypothetical protein [Syntrophales bacterium]